jgi:hypothetical protein
VLLPAWSWPLSFFSSSFRTATHPPLLLAFNKILLGVVLPKSILELSLFRPCYLINITSPSDSIISLLVQIIDVSTMQSQMQSRASMLSLRLAPSAKAKRNTARLYIPQSSEVVDEALRLAAPEYSTRY